jgi:hypothetical protein
MDVKLEHRGRVITSADVVFIRELIAAHPTASRRALSKRLCEAWNWVQPNGALRDMVCRGLMLQLHRAGYIQLPRVRYVPPNPLARRGKPTAPAAVIDTTPLEASLAVIRPLEFRQVRRSREEPLFNSLLEQHHYLGYRQPVGEHLKYLVYACGRPLACLAWSSAPRHLGPRDRFIEWSAAAAGKTSPAGCNTWPAIVSGQGSALGLAHFGHMARFATGLGACLRAPALFLETFLDLERSGHLPPIATGVIAPRGARSQITVQPADRRSATRSPGLHVGRA